MIVLASKSESRRAMLEAAGVEFRCEPANVDERGIEASLAGGDPGDIAIALAKAKAHAVSVQLDHCWVLGSDSLVEVDGRRYDKPATRREAAEHLARFSGRTIELTSAAALARDGVIDWEYKDSVRLKVRHLSDVFVNEYLDAEWPKVGACVGVFRIEGLGVQLFEHIDGSHFTVLGMPLLPVLRALRQRGELLA